MRLDAAVEDASLTAPADAPYSCRQKIRYLQYYAILHIIAICRVNFNTLQNCPK
jgi:hypothetical protein